MLAKIEVPVYMIKEKTTYYWARENNFPLFSIDRDSYIVSADVLSGIDFDWKSGVHNLQIGRHCVVGENILLVIDTNHDYGSVFQGCISGITNAGGHKPRRSKKNVKLLLKMIVGLLTVSPL